MKNKELKVGQPVFLEPCSNAARYSKKIIHAEVTSVGNKYFTVGRPSETYKEFRNKFSLETMQEHSEYSSDYIVHLSLADITEKMERPKLIQQILAKLSGVTFEDLKKLNESLV